MSDRQIVPIGNTYSGLGPDADTMSLMLRGNTAVPN